MLRAIREGASGAHGQSPWARRKRRDAEERRRLAEQLHRDAGAAGKPWTVSDPIELDEQVWFRLTVLGAGLGIRIGEALHEGARLVPDSFRIGAADRWGIRVETLGSLAAPGARRNVERITVTFLGPTTFRAADGKSHDPNPTPERLLGSWQRRWRGHLGTESLPGSAVPLTGAAGTKRLLDWVGACVTIEHQSLRWSNARPAGDRGRPLPVVCGTLHLLIQSAACPERDWFRALARFGAYSGSGRHLNVGFGQTWTQIAAASTTGGDHVRLLFAAHHFG